MRRGGGRDRGSDNTRTRNIRIPTQRFPDISVREKVLLSRSSGVSSRSLRCSTTHVMIEECPLCSNLTGGKANNLYKLYVTIGLGAYFCHRCGAGGLWFDFKRKVGGVRGMGAVTDTRGGMSGGREREMGTGWTSLPLPAGEESGLGTVAVRHKSAPLSSRRWRGGRMSPRASAAPVGGVYNQPPGSKGRERER